MNFERKCRICGTDILDFACGIPIFGDIFLDEKIRKYLYITVIPNDELPKILCATCYIKIQSIDKFANLAKKTEEGYITWLAKFNKNRSITAISLENKQFSNELPFTNLKLTHQKNDRNSRHVDHMTLEQIINEQIIKNPKIIETFSTLLTPLPENDLIKNDLNEISYSDIRLGLLIKDQELLKLILKALKWFHEDKNNDDESLIQKLKNTSFRDVLSNPNLLNDDDLVKLIKSYLDQDINTKPGSLLPSMANSGESNKCDHNFSYNTEDSVTQMEVGVDPDLFLPYDEEINCNNSKEHNVNRSISTERKDSKIGNSKVRRKKRKVIDDTHSNEKIKKYAKLKEKININDESKSNSPMKRKLSDILPKKCKTKRPTKREVILPKIDKKNYSKLSCAVCKKKLSTKGNLKVHMETHKPKGKHSCDKCNRVFKTILNLSRHKQYHGGEEYACNICKRVYSTKSTLRAHCITHSSDRPHKCEQCSRTFKRNQDLKFHLNQHSGERPYKCPYCTKTFASSGNCFSHRKRMHKNSEPMTSKDAVVQTANKLELRYSKNKNATQ